MGQCAGKRETTWLEKIPLETLTRSNQKDFETPLPELGIIQESQYSDHNFFNTANPPQNKPEISTIRSLIESNDAGVARHALEDWIQNNPDDSESIAVLLETIDPNEEPYLHSHYSSILLSLDKGSTIHLANLFSNSYSQLKSSNSYSITGLTSEFSSIIEKSPGSHPKKFLVQQFYLVSLQQVSIHLLLMISISPF